MGGQVGLADHLKISDGAMIGAQAGVMSDVDPGDVIVGSPAGPRKQRFIEFAALAKLPEMIKTLRSVLHRIERLEAKPTIDRSHREALRKVMMRSSHNANAIVSQPVSSLVNGSQNNNAALLSIFVKKDCLVAGWGSFPVEAAERCKQEGAQLYVVGLIGHADHSLSPWLTSFSGWASRSLAGTCDSSADMG